MTSLPPCAASSPVPFGVNVLWDPRATLAVAAATGAAFAREIFSGAFAGDFGLWVRSAGDTFRYRREVSAEGCRLIFNINAEFAAPIAPRPLAEVARSVVFSSMPDALCVSGPITGQPADASGLADVAQASRIGRPGPDQHRVPRFECRRVASVRGRRNCRLEPEDGRRDLESGRSSARPRADGRRP